MQHNPFHGYPGDDDMGGWWGPVGEFLVPSSHTTTYIYDDGWDRREEGLDRHPGLRSTLPYFLADEFPDILLQGPEACLILCWVSEERKPGTNDVTGLLVYPFGYTPIGIGWLLYFP